LSRTVWRSATDTPHYEADDLSGEGAKRTGGRWNEKGVPVVYTSQNRAMACLETVVHLNAGGLPLNRYLVAVTIPDDVWDDAQSNSASGLPVGWDAEPPGRASISFGTDWIRSGGSALLIISSVIVPEEFNVLINPQHPASSGITATKVRKWLYDPRLKAV
jgi:RES domain-containing protein